MGAAEDEDPSAAVALREHETVHMLLPGEEEPAQERQVPDGPAHLDARGLAAAGAAAALAAQLVGGAAAPALERAVEREAEHAAPERNPLLGAADEPAPPWGSIPPPQAPPALPRGVGPPPP